MGRLSNQYRQDLQGSGASGTGAPPTNDTHYLDPLRHGAHIPTPCSSPEAGPSPILRSNLLPQSNDNILHLCRHGCWCDLLRHKFFRLLFQSSPLHNPKFSSHCFGDTILLYITGFFHTFTTFTFSFSRYPLFEISNCRQLGS